MPTPLPLADTVEALLSAMNDGRADDARALVRPDAWDAGPRPPAAMTSDKTLLLQAFPAVLEGDGRAAVRIMGFHKEGQRESWWFLLEEVPETGWRLAALGATRLDAERFLKGEPAPAPAPPPTSDAPYDPLSALPPKLRSVVERVAKAIAENDLDAARALSTADAWQAPDHSPSKLASKIGRARPKVSYLDGRVRSDRAAVEMGFLSDRGGGNAYLVFHLDKAFGWQWIAATTNKAPAALYVAGRVDAVPTWDALPADTVAARWGKAFVEAHRAGSGPLEGVDAESWARLVQDLPEGHEVRLGEVRALPAVNRAAVEISLVDPANPDEPDRRYAVLARANAEAPWTFQGVSFARGLLTLLDGVEVDWEEPPPTPFPDLGEPVTPEEEDALREAVKRKIFQTLADQGFDASNFDDLSKLPKEEVEKILPQLVGGAFAALFGTLMGRMKETLDEAEARDPAVTVDLDRERAKRAGVPVPELSETEDAVSREVRSALREALHAATKDGEAKVDAAFLRDQGPMLLGSLFGAVAKAMVPAEMTLDVPPEPGKEGEKPVKVKLPLGEMLGALFAQAAPPRPQGPQTPDDAGDEE